MASEATEQTNTAVPGGAKPQPVAMEIPVTVNGASTVAGSDKRQPFSETTQTVLVFGSGAVIRLAAAVGPGQLLFVTNEKSKQEVVCQVVKTKQNGSGAGYVELKFTEATTDFWGVRVPGNGTGSAIPAAPSVAAPGALGTVGVPAKTLEQKLTDSKTTAPSATQPDSVRMPATIISVVPPSVVPSAPVAQANEIQAAPVVPAQPPAQPKVPTLSEFLTHGSNGPELKAPERTQTEKIEKTEAGRIGVLTEEKPATTTPLASRVSGEPEAKRSLSVALGVSQNPAPGSASFDLSADLPAEEVKIPAWLEPLARNSARVEGKTADSIAPEIPTVELHVEEIVPAIAPAESVQEHEAAPILAAEGRTPNFGTSLALDSQTDGARSGKGLKIALAIAALLLAAAAAWYWFVTQAPKVSAGGNGTVAESNPASVPEPGTRSSASEPTGSATNSLSGKANLPTTAVSQPTVTTTGRPSVSTTSTNAATKSAVSSNSPISSPAEDVIEEAAKKPALGQVRLAAPKVTRSAADSESGTADPGLAMSSTTPADSSTLSFLSNKGKGPAVPLPVGGDVKVARLLSSVPPVYPQMARAQRVSGNVTIDALIDVNGRVTTTRVISGPALLHDAAMNAVKQWKYQPATLNGIPTATHLNVTVQFRLQ